MRLELEENGSTCPKCGAPQQNGISCIRCGIVFHKISGTAARSTNSPVQSPGYRSEHNLPFATLIRLSQLILLCSLFLLVLSYHYQDVLPPADFYADVELSDPVQSKTSLAPFKVRSSDIIYTITPIQNYRLQGVVVSYHNSDAWWDIYHHRSWQDFINIKDICVIWGENVSSGIYLNMAFKNSTWTCWAYWPDTETARRFSMHQLSNNHLLVLDENIREKLDQVEIGDLIRLSGVLASYSHSNGQFYRGTSTSRTDTGNGACETILLTEFDIVKSANPGWQRLNTVAWWLCAVSLILIPVLIVRAPVRWSD
ncbi:MAG: hypothetical protein KDI27_00935 [Gammaproteobacteria bacterium]|nr:hypothetical protein [Gammaproteobacteria bacterium]